MAEKEKELIAKSEELEATRNLFANYSKDLVY